MPSDHRQRRQSTEPQPPSSDYSDAISRAFLATLQPTGLLPAAEAARRLEELLSLPAEERIPRACSHQRYQNPAVLEQLALHAIQEAQTASTQLAELAVLGCLLTPLVEPAPPDRLIKDHVATFTALWALASIHRGGRLFEAARYLAHALRLADRGTGDPLVLALLLHVAGLLLAHRYQDAPRLLQAAADLYRALDERELEAWVVDSLLRLDLPPPTTASGEPASAPTLVS